VTFPDPEVELAWQEPTALLALTVLGEAEGEPDEGKSAVAHVVKNRMRKKPYKWGSVADTVLAPWQFSCWNHEEPRRDFLLDVVDKGAANIPMSMWVACWKAASGALDGTSTDPTHGATHYCTENIWGVDDGNRHRARWHSLQEIQSERTVQTAHIGRHVFARAA
jgi:spore germination cell wall hydrolase CwlJ-like protein